MRSLRSGRALRRIILVMVVAFIATTVAFSATSGERNWPVSAPARAAAPTAPPSISAVLESLGTANAFWAKVPNMPGESLNADHPNEIVVHDVGMTINNSAGTATGGSFTGISLGKNLDRASPLLMKAASGGTLLGTVVISAEKDGADPVTYLTLTLTGAKVRSFVQAIDEQNGPHENIVLGFTSLKYAYRYQNNTGTFTTYTGCWNLLTHAGC